MDIASQIAGLRQNGLNPVGNVMQGMQYGQAINQMKQQRAFNNLVQRIAQGDEDAIRQGSAIDPAGTMNIVRSQQAMREQQTTQQSAQMEQAARLLSFVEEQPENVRPAAYQQARQMFMEQYPGAKIPEQYDQNFVRGTLARAVPYLEQFKARNKMSDGTEFGVTPVYGVDKQGNTVLLQMSKAGGAQLAQMPDGVRPVRSLAFRDTGSEQIGVDPLTGRPVVRYAKDLAPEKAPDYLATAEGAKTRAKATADAAAALPSIEDGANYMISLLDELENHPGLERAVGTSSVVPVVPGTDAADFVARLDQLQGRQFLEAYNSLRGGGQITEVEGKKAEQAIARMQRSQSEKEFRAAVAEFKTVVAKGVKAARKKAGANKAEQDAPDIDALLQKYGAN